ncbi:hypothetical protein CR513_43898, partial [Mucuna pruriens]
MSIFSNLTHDKPKRQSVPNQLTENTKIGARLGHWEEDQLVVFLRKNRDAFAWGPKEMSGIDLDFLCHRLSIILGARKKRKMGDEKRRVEKEKIGKLLAAHFIRYPLTITTLAQGIDTRH